jgi:Skp family chaperone for outer membrane proteins
MSMSAGRILGALAAALAVSALAASAAEGPRPLKVAVLDVDKVLHDYKKSDDLLKQISERFKPLEEALKKESEFIRAERRRLDDENLDPDSVELFKKKQAIQLRIAEFQTKEKAFLIERSAAELKAMSEVWADLVAATARHAKDKGLDLVIKQQLREEPSKSKESFFRNVAGCTVIYHADYLDCTDEVLKLMNSDYERGGKAPEAPEIKTPVPTPKGGKKG